MKKSWLIALALVVVLCSVTLLVSANATLPTECDHCDTEVTWTPMSEVADDATSIPAGHYYYDYEDATHAWTAVKGVSGAVCIYMPADKTLTGPTRVFTVNNGGTLSIMGEGTIAGIGYEGTTSDGGTISVASGGKLYLHSGILTINTAEGRQVRHGGVVYVAGGELHISGGQITGGKSVAYGTKAAQAGNGGNVYLASSAKMYMSGGAITGGSASGNSYCAGGNVYVNNGCTVEMSGGSISGGSARVGNDVSTRGRFILSGDANVDQLRLSPLSSGHVSDTLGISGVYTGTVNLQAATDYFVEGTSFGIATNASILRATINVNTTANKASGFYLAVCEERLYVTATQPTYTKNARCEKCGANVDWQLMTESAASASTIAEGHYYVDVLPDSASWAQKTISGKVCLDLNGMDLKFASRAFLVDDGGILSIQGSGSVTSGGFASGTANNSRLGGVIMARAGSEVNLYGGTYTNALAEETNIYAYNGGVAWCAGAFNMYGGTLKNGQATYAAGNLFLQTNATALLAGGKITGGTAGEADTNIYSKGHITLTGNPTIEDLSHKDDGSLNVKGAFTGSVLLGLSKYTPGKILGTATENASIRKASISLDTVAIRHIMIDGDELKVSDSEPVYPEKTETRYCEACGRNATFRAINEDFSEDASITTGHFFLDFQGGVGVMEPRMVSGSGRVCLDLNGQTWKSTGRVFDVRDGCFLNVMDSVGGGVITGCGPTGTSAQYGGTIYVRYGAELNLYSGTISYYAPTDDRPVIARGGVIYTEGDFNMYGGAVSGGVSTTGAGVYGAAISSGVSRIGLYGGTISGGNATRVGDGIIYAGYLTLSGDADIVNIRLSSGTYSPARGDSLIIEGAYTGTTEFTYADITVGADVGNSANANISGATITCYNLSGAQMQIVGNDLVFVKGDPAAVIQKQDGTSATYTSLNEAIAAFDAATDIKLVLFADAADVAVSKDVYLDLNGHSITGSITGEGKLYCMDSATDDYDVTDGKYGKVTKAANVVGVPVEAACAEDGYLIVEENGTLSFHRLTLKVKSMSLRPSEAGIYFKSTILCDSIAADQVESFGVALDLSGEPTEEKIGTSTICTVFTKEQFAAGGSNTSTLVNKVLKSELDDVENNRRAGMSIYAKVYITLEDGTMLFGECRHRSLKEQVEGIDASENFIHVTVNQKRAFMDMYYAYESVMGADDWSTANAKAIASRKKVFAETDYTPYLAPYTAEMLEAAKTDGKIHYFFMAGEGLHISDTQTYKDKWGDAYLIVFPNGQLMLVDCGPLSYAPVLYKNLEKMGITHLDYMLVSHPHSDHQNGVFADSAILNVGLLDKISVGQIYYRGGWDPDRLDDTIIDRIAPQYGIPYEAVEKGRVLQIGEVRMEVIWPLEGDGDSYTSGGQDINDMSVVVRLDYGEHSSLLTGDLYTTGENMILERVDNALLDVDFLKVPHHGYATSSSSAFLEAISPELAMAIGRLPIPNAIYERYEGLGINLLDDRQKGYVHVWAGADGVLEYTTSRESFEGTTPDAGDEDPLPDEDTGDDA